MTEPIDLDAIRARIPDCYDAPWCVEYLEGSADNAERWLVMYATDNPLAGLVAAVPDYGERLAEFIAHARTDVPALLAEVDRLRAALDTPSLLDVYAAEAATLRADVQRLTAHSVTLNAIGWCLAEALGRVPDGADSVLGNPARDLETLIAERDLHSRQREAMRPVVEAAVAQRDGMRNLAISDRQIEDLLRGVAVAVDAYTAAAPAQRAQDGPTEAPGGERIGEGAPDTQATAAAYGVSAEWLAEHTDLDLGAPKFGPTAPDRRPA